MRNLIYVYYIVLLLASLLAIKNFNKLNKSLKIFGILVIATFVVELFAFYLAKTIHNNIIVYVVFTPIQIILINSAYYMHQIDSLFRKTSIALTLMFIVYFITQIGGLNLSVFPDKLIMIENIILCIIVAYSSYLIVSKQHYIEMKKNKMIWINMGFLFFLSTSFFIWGFHHLIKTNEINLILRFTLIISNIILYSIMALVFLKVNLKSEII
jgi:hypothetical protein